MQEHRTVDTQLGRQLLTLSRGYAAMSVMECAGQRIRFQPPIGASIQARAATDHQQYRQNGEQQRPSQLIHSLFFQADPKSKPPTNPMKEPRIDKLVISTLKNTCAES